MARGGEGGRVGWAEPIPESVLRGLEGFLAAFRVITDSVDTGDHRGLFQLTRVFLFVAVASKRFGDEEPVTNQMVAKALGYATTNVSRILGMLSVGSLDHHADRDDKGRHEVRPGLGWVEARPYLHDRRLAAWRLTPLGDRIMRDIVRALGVGRE